LPQISNALDEGDFIKASKAAHSLKGMCGTLNASALMELALELEMACRERNKAEAMRLKNEVERLLDVVVERIAAFMA
jgi:HPt (histidine-containing phosphotransfer) domain-containing protein